MIAVTGAALVLSTLLGLNAGSKRAFASAVRTKRMRAGHEFALVGPDRMIW